ncbi:MAG TPA: hypothetical protein VF892_21105, partial [Pseudonocardiaceae bacterium]
ILAAYAPAQAVPRGELPVVEPGPDAIAETLDRATAHGDEHVIKFSDTAADVFARTGEPDALAAAVRVSTLIGG